MRTLLECVGAAARIGHKAEVLARARSAGIDVPDGFVVEPEEIVSADALRQALAALDAERFAVRSSATLEDSTAGSAAGLFTSVVDVPASGVAAAIDLVRASAHGSAVRHYAQALGVESGVKVAVLVQPFVAAARLGVAHSDPAGGWQVEERPASTPEWSDSHARHVGLGPLAEGLLQLEKLIGASVDAEYAVMPDGAVRFLQARPLVIGGGFPPRRAQPDEPPPRWAAPNVLRPWNSVAGDWTLDAQHNPEPLSAAQASLVAHVERLGIGRPQLVVGGYLYVGKTSRNLPKRVLGPAELPRVFAEELVPACRQAMAAASSLEEVLRAYDTMYSTYVGVIAPALARARFQLDQFLRINLGGEGLEQHASVLGGLGGATTARNQSLHDIGRDPARLDEHIARFGAYSPAWDVAVPTDGEDRDRLRFTAARLAATRAPALLHAEAIAAADAAAHEILERLDRMARRAWKALLPVVRAALAVSEDDDQLFYEAQAAIRRHLLAVGDELVAAGRLDARDDVFELPIPHPAGDLVALVRAGREARMRAGRALPPASFDAGVPRWFAPAGDALRGTGVGGRARGRAVVVGAEVPPQLAEDAVLVVAALSPGLAHLVPQARAIVTAYGGALSHGATLARECGVPAVLGVAGALEIAPGSTVTVDGTAGRVYVEAT